MKTFTSIVLMGATLPCVVLGQCSTSSYYSGINLDLTGPALETALHNLIDNHNEITYDEVWEALKETDAYNGDTSTGEVLLVYKNVGWDKDQTLGNGVSGDWNREHLWPQSRFGRVSSGAYTDLFNLRSCDMNVNSARGNEWFDNCFSSQGCTQPAHSEAASDTGSNSDQFMPPAVSRGDIARSIFYMHVRYDGVGESTPNLMVSNCPWNENNMGVLDTLLAWHRSDPPSAFEIRRNNIICEDYQGNRNPFIDYPDLVDQLFASGELDYDGCTPPTQQVPPYNGGTDTGDDDNNNDGGGSVCIDQEVFSQSCSSYADLCPEYPILRKYCQSTCNSCGETCSDNSPSYVYYSGDSTDYECSEFAAYCSSYEVVSTRCPVTCGTCAQLSASSSAASDPVSIESSSSADSDTIPKPFPILEVVVASTGAAFVGVLAIMAVVVRRRSKKRAQEQEQEQVTTINPEFDI